MCVCLCVGLHMYACRFIKVCIKRQADSLYKESACGVGCSACVAVCCSVVQCVAVWCSVVQCVAISYDSVLQCVVKSRVLQCVAVWCSV